MTTVDFITALFCRVDDRMPDVPQHPQAHLYPSEVVTIALLVWAWIWGAMGLILAIPLMGALKIICDHIAALRPFGAWMEE